MTVTKVHETGLVEVVYFDKNQNPKNERFQEKVLEKDNGIPPV